MTFSSRVGKLERQLGDTICWAIFSIGCYENESQRQSVRKRLILDYEKNHETHPTHCLFINELPFLGAICKEEYIGSFKELRE